jgi:hypothetical protein
MPIELTGLFSMMLGVWYPRNYLVAAIDPANGAAAVKALSAAGFGSQSVHLTEGTGVLEIKRQIEAQRTPIARVAASVSHALTDEGLMSQQYFDEAAAGASLIAVLAPEPRQVTHAGQVLAANQARRIRYYGDNTITDL